MNRLVTVAIVSWREYDVVRELLESHGIAVDVCEAELHMFGIYGGYEFQVLEKDAVRAEYILKHGEYKGKLWPIMLYSFRFRLWLKHLYNSNRKIYTLIIILILIIYILRIH